MVSVIITTFQTYFEFNIFILTVNVYLDELFTLQTVLRLKKLSTIKFIIIIGQWARAKASCSKKTYRLLPPARLDVIDMFLATLVHFKR